MKPYYDDGRGIQIFLGDCREILPGLAKVDAIISDPPYGMNNDADSNRFMPKGKKQKPCRAHSKIHGDDKPFNPCEWLDYSKVVLWGANHYFQQLPVGTTLIWLKRHPEVYGQFLSDAEIAWMKGGHGVYCYYKQFPPPVKAMEVDGDPCRPTTPHPNQKPLGLMAWCITMAGVLESETVLDPFMGSGTTLRACKDLGRSCIGIEIEERYAEIAARRLQQEVLSL